MVSFSGARGAMFNILVGLRQMRLGNGKVKFLSTHFPSAVASSICIGKKIQPLIGLGPTNDQPLEIAFGWRKK